MDSIIQRLRALGESSPELQDAAQIYARILPVLHGADLHPAPILISAEQAHTKLETGLPLLHDLDLDLDYRAAGELLIQLARALEQAHVPAARPFRRAVQHGKLDARVLLPHVAKGDRGYAFALAEGLDLDPGFAWTVAENALKPALRVWRRNLSSFVNGVEWRRGYCPVCGSAATLGELTGNEQVKYLRCAQCGADWQFPRMQCMYCGNDDHSALGYLSANGAQDKSRIEVCDRCGGYLKVIAAFSPTPVELLPVEDLATLYLDYIAQERGYARVQVR